MSSAPRVVALIDLDAFYVAVERTLDPSLVGKPVAVCQYNTFTKGGVEDLSGTDDRRLKPGERAGNFIAVSYEARAAGVKRHLTVAECGLHANSSLQVLGRLRGGVEVPLFGRQHSLGDTGLLDLKGQYVGPAKLKEVAAFLASAESAAVRRLVLSGNEITSHGEDLSGLEALCEVLPTLKHPISLDLANCGLGVAEVNELAQAISAGAVLNSVTLDSSGIFGRLDFRYSDSTREPDKFVEQCEDFFSSLKT